MRISIRSSLRVITLLTAAASAQESRYTLTNWRVEDGLPQSSVRCITQTPDGYLWVGTWNGLARFDGIRFTSFHSGNTPALRSSSIIALFPDSKGTLWIGTEGGGVVRYKDGVFSNLDSSLGFRASRVHDFMEDREGRLWIATHIGIYVLRGDTLLHFDEQDGLPNDYAGQTLLRSDGSVYLGMVDYFSHARLFGDSLHIYESFTTGGHAAAVDADDRLVYGLDGRGLIKRKDGRTTVDRRFANLGPDEVFIFGDGKTWVTSNEFVYVLEHDVVHSLKKVSGVAIGSVGTIFMDRERNIWMSKSGGGLNRLRPKHIDVVSPETGFADYQIMCGMEDRSGGLWIGTWVKGLQRRKVQGGPFERVPLPVTGPPMTDLKQFSDGSIWASSWASGTFVIRENVIERFERGPIRKGMTTSTVTEDPRGGFWVGTVHEGAVHFRPNGHTVWNTAKGLSSNDVNAILCSRSGDVWVATAVGVNRISNGVVTVIDSRSGLSNDFVGTVLEDTSGALWIATSRGLNLWRPNEPGRAGSPGSIFAFTQKHGLPDDVINQIIEDDGNFWIGSIHGIFRVRKRALLDVADGRAEQVQCLSLGREDGMLNEECAGDGNSRTWRTNDGRLWFATSSGAVSFDPTEVAEDTDPPNVIIEEVSVENERRAFDSTITLQPGETKVELVYTGINFFAPRKIRFRHMLEGLEEEWTDVGVQRSARFTNLSPGTYRFRVSAANRAGFWNDAGTSISIVVIPPFWATWWFRGGSFLFVAGAIVWSARLFERQRMRRRLEEMERKAALELERLRIARDLHDEVGARLTEIGLMTDTVRKKKRVQASRAEIEEIGTTARGVIDSFREVVWTVSPQQDSLSSLVDFVQQYATRYLGKASIRVRFDMPMDVPEVTIPSAARHEIFMVIKEALNNIVKHARAGEVFVTCAVEGSHIRMVIEDNGRGLREGPSRRTSNGLKNMQKRMESIGGSAEVASDGRRGTVVNVTFPVTFA